MCQVVWKTRGHGTNMGRDLQGNRLMHVAFADDITLVARTCVLMKRMVLSLRDALRKGGLQLHPTTCKAQTSSTSAKRGAISTAEDFAVNVTAEHDCLEVLGTHLSLQDPTKAELDHRISVAWHKFWILKIQLIDSKVSRKHRLQ